MGNNAGKLVYSWGNGQADGDASLKHLLGGKGANLQEMIRLGVPVPPGFTLTTGVWSRYEQGGKSLDADSLAALDAGLARLESDLGRRLGDASDPLLISIRSGAPVSMPGMMDTVLNLGLNDATVEGLATKSGKPEFAWDCYRRFVQMYGDVVLGVETHVENVPTDLAGLQALVRSLKALILDKSGVTFPDDPKEQLTRSVEAVFASWMNNRAIIYRRIQGIADHTGTACSVVAMVYGNRGDRSGTGVLFTRNPNTGEDVLYGNYLADAQGEDVVAGTHNALSFEAMADIQPEAHGQLVALADKLERHYVDVQDIEFTIEDEHLWLLQTRSAKRTAAAAVKIAVDYVSEGRVSKKQALQMVPPERLEQLFKPQIDPTTSQSVLDQAKLASGEAASFGAGVGQIVFHADDAVAGEADGQKTILVRTMTTPDDVAGMKAAKAILTHRGGKTSHAAVVARDMGQPCVIGCDTLRIDANARTLTLADTGKVLKEGDWITVDGSTGHVYEGRLAVVDPKPGNQFEELMAWSDEFRRLGIRANADTPDGAAFARRLGARGIGLCRTEHMFREPERLEVMREMILTAEDEKTRRRALDKVFPLQRGDFEQILRTMEGLPVTIRLLDPPLHEFLPEEDEDVRALAKTIGSSEAEVREVMGRMHESNPMLGHRGCRLGITHPAIYQMQVRAIAHATASLRRDGVDARPEIMIPLIAEVRELERLRTLTEEVLAEVSKETGSDLTNIPIGTMIEFPRACLTADRIAEVADFFSFGTNDLTQTTWGLSRDDTAALLASYQEQGLIDVDPFVELDRSGVGQLVEMATAKGRSTKDGLKVGICGEHGGEPRSVAFCHGVGLDYVSCSPYRVPVARLSAALAAIDSE